MRFITNSVINDRKTLSNDVNLSLEKVTQLPTLGHFTFNEST